MGVSVAQPAAGIEGVAFSSAQHGEFELHAAQREFQLGRICCLRYAIVGCVVIDGLCAGAMPATRPGCAALSFRIRQIGVAGHEVHRAEVFVRLMRRVLGRQPASVTQVLLDEGGLADGDESNLQAQCRHVADEAVQGHVVAVLDVRDGGLAQGAWLALAVVAQAALAVAGGFTYLAQLLAQVGQYVGVVGGAWGGHGVGRDGSHTVYVIAYST